MGFLERSRSLRRKDSAVPLKYSERSAAAQLPAEQSSEVPVAQRERRATLAAQNAVRPSTTTKATSRESRPQTAGQGKQTPMTPDYYSPAYKFPSTSTSASASPRASSFRSHNITHHANASSAAISVNSLGVSSVSSKAPLAKRSFTTPVPQATVHQGKVMLSTKNLPTLDMVAASDPVPPTPTVSTPTQKKPTLHKSRSSVWKSFFQRRQSKPSVPEFNPSELAPPVPKNDLTNVTPSSGSGPKDLSPMTAFKQGNSQMASSNSESSEKNLATTPKVDVDPPQEDTQSRARQKAREILEKGSSEKQRASSASISPAESRVRSQQQQQQQLRPSISRSNTGLSTVSSMTSQTFYDALSRTSSLTTPNPSSPAGGKASTPRLEVSIPTVSMERYSVMFEKVLEPKQSLLERRKTNLQGLSLPEEKGTGKASPSLDSPGARKRRATSPNVVTPTPLTAEFLESSSQLATPIAIHRISGVPRIKLRRAQTAPLGEVGPESGVEKQKKQQQQQQQQQQQRKYSAGDNISSACSTSNSAPWSEASEIPGTPDTTTEEDEDEDEDEDDTATFVDFDDYDEEDVEIVTYDTKTLKPRFKEPSWELMTKTTSSSSSSPSSGVDKNTAAAAATTTAAAAAAAATMQLPQAPPIPVKSPGRAEFRQEKFPPRSTSLATFDVPAVDGKDKHSNNQNAVNVRRIGGPSSSSSAAAAASSSSSTPASASSPLIRAGQATAHPVSMYSKQPLRPQLVEVRNRKSTMIVLESASSSSLSSASVSRESVATNVTRC